MKVTIDDIAKMVGVSKSTVSRYLNKGYVSKEKAEQIQKAIDKTGFKSNFFAKRIKASSSRLIGIVIPRFDSYTTSKILRSINIELEKSGYQGIILSSELDSNKEIKNMRSLYNQGVDGLIVMTSSITKKHIEIVNSFNIPVVFTGQSSKFVNYIKINDRAIGREIGEYVKKSGHKNIVYLGVSEKDQAVGVERKQGFFDVFNDLDGYSINYVETDFSFNKAYEVASKVFQYNPTVVVGATDNIALGFIRYAFEKGLEIPNDISVAGIGGYDIGLSIHPTITTVEIDYYTLGKKATRLIISLIKDEEYQDNMDIPFKLIERQSVKKI